MKVEIFIKSIKICTGGSIELAIIFKLSILNDIFQDCVLTVEFLLEFRHNKGVIIVAVVIDVYNYSNRILYGLISSTLSSNLLLKYLHPADLTSLRHALL